MRFLPLCVIALGFASAALAQQSPSEVTDAEIAKYKKAAYDGCAEPGLKRGDPQAAVDAFCSCMVATLEKSMKRPEWQQAYFYWHKAETDQHNAVVKPHLANVKQCAQKPPAPPAPESTQPAQKP